MSTRSVVNRKSYILALVLVCAFLDGLSQVVQSARLEIAVPDALANVADKFKTVGLGDNGLLIYRRISQFDENGQDQLEMIKVDTVFKQDWKGFFIVPRNLGITKVHYDNGVLFFLFKHQFLIGGDFQVAAVRVSSGKSSLYTIKNLIPFTTTDFVSTSRAVVIGGYYNDTPVAIYYSLIDRTSKILTGFFNGPGELNQLKTYPDGSFDAITCARNSEKRKELTIRNYGAMGDLLKVTVIEPEENKHLLFGRSVKLANGNQLVAGVYGRFSEYSRGIFLSEVNPQGDYNIRYYNFGDLHNFFSYMKIRTQKRILHKIERRREKGRRVKFNYRFLIHDLIPYHEQYILTGEAFYPHYSSRGTMSPFASPYISSSALASMRPAYRSGDLILDGYQYTHAVVVGFDKTGKIKWDNSFEINDVKTRQLESFVEVKPEKDRIVMMYLFENNLRSKIIRDSEVLEGKAKEAMGTETKTKSREMYDRNESLHFWYGDYFVASGIQKVKRQTGPGASTVFYVNKISYK